MNPIYADRELKYENTQDFKIGPYMLMGVQQLWQILKEVKYTFYYWGPQEHREEWGYQGYPGHLQSPGQPSKLTKQTFRYVRNVWKLCVLRA